MRLPFTVAIGLAMLSAGVFAQGGPTFDSPDETRAALQEALADQRMAEERSQSLRRKAAAARDAADKAAHEAASMAASVQQAEAGIAAAEARMALVDRERARLREELGVRQKPIVELTAALQQFSRRPVALSLMRPGSVKDVVYLRAMLDSAVPQVHAKTAGLRQQLDRSRRLRREAEQAVEVLQAEEGRLAERQAELATLETRQRLASREARGGANREAERALALAEEARDLDSLVVELDRAGSLRARLAALPGPSLRPQRPAAAQVALAPPQANGADAAAGSPNAAPSPYFLPVAGRTITGFGAPGGAGLSRGLTLAPRGGAQVVAPAAGRVAFAGPYRGYGQIVIIEHDGGWNSLITGLARSDVEVGGNLVGGAPIGVAGPGRPEVTLELRRDGKPVNPLEYTG